VFLLPARFAPLLSLQRTHRTLVMCQVTWKRPRLAPRDDARRRSSSRSRVFPHSPGGEGSQPGFTTGTTQRPRTQDGFYALEKYRMAASKQSLFFLLLFFIFFWNLEDRHNSAVQRERSRGAQPGRKAPPVPQPPSPTCKVNLLLGFICWGENSPSVEECRDCKSASCCSPTSPRGQPQPEGIRAAQGAARSPAPSVECLLNCGEFTQLGRKLALPSDFCHCQLFLLAPCLSSLEELALHVKAVQQLL